MRLHRQSLALAVVLAHGVPAAVLAAQAPVRFLTSQPGTVTAVACAGTSRGTGQNRAGRDAALNGYDLEDCVVNAGASPQSAARTLASSAGPMSGEARASFGSIGFAGSNEMVNWVGTGLWFPGGRGVAGWTDAITIVDPTRTGQTGLLEGAIRLTGTLSASGSAGGAGVTLYAFSNWMYELSNSGVELFNERFSTAGPPARSMSYDVVLPVAWSFTFGTPLTVGIWGMGQAQPRAEGANPRSAFGSADFLNTAVWQGVTRVSVGGAAVDRSTIALGSTGDWLVGPQQVVPEPASAALLAVGLCALGACGVRRRRR